MPISILLVDDHSLVRQGLSLLLGQDARVTIVGEASDGVEAVELASKLKPRVVVMDVGLPKLNGTEATGQILAKCPETRVLALSAYGDRQHVLGILRAGAAGYVMKDAAVDELVEAVEVVANGGHYVSPSLSNTVLSECLSGAGGGRGERLTMREREVLQLISEGKAMKQVAMDLHISTKTVETHRRSVMEKLQLFSVAELTKHAVREGLTTID